MAKILIGCRLPNGLTLHHPDPEKRNVKVTLAGLNRLKIIGNTHNTTEVDADFWELWKTAYSDFAPLKTGAIFEAKSLTDAGAKAVELVKEKTGFEPLEKDAPGIKPLDKD
jgi:hypothetical protein